MRGMRERDSRIGSSSGRGAEGGKRRGMRRARRGQMERGGRSEEHTSELQSRPHISYAVFCLKKKKQTKRLRPKNKIMS